MALPKQIKAARMSNSTAADNIDNDVVALENALGDIFGIPFDEDITEPVITMDTTGRITKALVRLLAAGPVGFRFRDSTASKEFRLALSGANIVIDENTGTEGTPIWTNRVSIALATGVISVGGQAMWSAENDGAGSGLDADLLDGAQSGNDAGEIPINNTTVCTNLNSDMVDGKHATGLTPKVAFLVDSKASGTDGGTFDQGAWQIRTNLSKQSDPDGLVTSIGPSEPGYNIFLVAGTYDVYISVPAYGVSEHQARLRNMQSGETVLLGTSEYAALSQTTRSVIQGRFTHSGGWYQIQHRCVSSQAVNGFGESANFGENEIYTIARFQKVSL